MSPIPEKRFGEIVCGDIQTLKTLFVPSGGEAVSYITTQQSAVRVSQRGKQNITRYARDSAMLTIISQSEKIGKR